jgi:hypothetical protein
MAAIKAEQWKRSGMNLQGECPGCALRSALTPKTNAANISVSFV